MVAQLAPNKGAMRPQGVETTTSLPVQADLTKLTLGSRDVVPSCGDTQRLAGSWSETGAAHERAARLILPSFSIPP